MNDRDYDTIRSLNLPAERGFRIIVSDDHPVFCDGLVRVVQAAFPDADVAEAGTFAETLALAELEAPNLFLMDLLFPGMDPRIAIPDLQGAYPAARIAIVSMIEDQATVDRMMKLGIDGYIAKSISYDRMVAAIRDIVNGTPVTAISNHPPLWSPALSSVQNPPALTPRQRDVLFLLQSGKSNKEIGRVLSISPFTVRIHVSALLRLLHVETRAHAAAAARSMRFEFEAGN